MARKRAARNACSSVRPASTSATGSPWRKNPGAINIEGLEDMPYTTIYYGVYFEDLCGNRLEIYYCEE